MKKVISLFIILALLLTFTACGDSSQSSDPVDSSNQSQVVEKEDEFATSNSFTSFSSSKNVFNNKLYIHNERDLVEVDLQDMSTSKVDNINDYLIINETVSVFIKDDNAIYIDVNSNLEKTFNGYTIPYGKSYYKMTEDGYVLCNLNDKVIAELPMSLNYYGGFIDDEYYYVEIFEESNTYCINSIDLSTGVTVKSNVLTGRDDGFTNYSFDGTKIIITNSECVEIFDVKNGEKRVINFDEVNFIDTKYELIVSYIGKTKSFLYFNITDPLYKYNLNFRVNLDNNEINKLSNEAELICDGTNVYQYDVNTNTVVAVSNELEMTRPGNK